MSCLLLLLASQVARKSTHPRRLPRPHHQPPRTVERQPEHVAPVVVVPVPAVVPPVVPPPAPAPVPLDTRIADVDVHGSLLQADVRRAVDRIVPALHQCVPTGAPRTVQISFTIDDSRRALNVRGAGATSCIVAAFGGVRTESAPDVGEADIAVHVAFETRR